MRRLRIVGALCLALSGTVAQATEYREYEVRGGAVLPKTDVILEPREVVVAPEAVIEGRSYDSLWLGHFAGGNNVAPGVEPIQLQWVDEQAYFASDHECKRWLRSMRSAYHTYAGYKSCRFIR